MVGPAKPPGRVNFRPIEGSFNINDFGNLRGTAFNNLPHGIASRRLEIITPGIVKTRLIPSSRFFFYPTEKKQNQNDLVLYQPQQRSLARFSLHFWNFLKTSFRAFIEYLNNRNPAFLLMVLPPGGRRKFPQTDPLIVEQIKKRAHLSIVEEAFKRLSSDPNLKKLKVDLKFNADTGEILSDDQVRDLDYSGWFQISVNVELKENQIRLSQNLIQNLEQMAAIPNLPVTQRSILVALLELHETPLRRSDITPKGSGKGKGNRRGIAYADTLTPERTSEKTGQRFGDTLPLETITPRAPSSQKEEKPTAMIRVDGTPQEIPLEFISKAETIRTLLGNFARIAWNKTSFVNSPPLLAYLNPPVLIGALVIDAMGGMIGHQFRRTDFSSTGKVYPEEPLPTDETLVRVLVGKEGSLFTYELPPGASPFFKTLFDALKGLPRNQTGVQQILTTHPLLWELVYQLGIGKAALDLNLVLAKGERENSKYLLRVCLIKTSNGYRWEPYSGKKVPDGTLALLDIGVQVRPTLKGFPGPEFHYRLVTGRLPEEVVKMLNIIKWQVEEGAPTD